MGKKLGTKVAELGKQMKQDAKDHLVGLYVFAWKSPFMFGRYITFEAFLAGLLIYKAVKHRHLEWVDD